jgi:hypothetical protein
MSDIRINEPGAGEWIMSQLGVPFTPRYDNPFSSQQGRKYFRRVRAVVFSSVAA